MDRSSASREDLARARGEALELLRVHAACAAKAGATRGTEEAGRLAALARLADEAVARLLATYAAEPPAPPL